MDEILVESLPLRSRGIMIECRSTRSGIEVIHDTKSEEGGKDSLNSSVN